MKNNTGCLSSSLLNNIGAPYRLLPMEALFNVRDLGGYPANGKHVKWGLIYRSGDLHHATENDLAQLNERNIRTIIDFRMPREIANAPHKLPASIQSVIETPIDPGNILAFNAVNDQTGADLMIKINQDLVNLAQEQYRLFFKTLANSTNTPLLFNCSAGKDRTGLAAALFLSALGVEKETIFQDYLLSAPETEKKYQSELKAAPWLLPLLTVKRQYLQAAFDEIDTRYQGMNAYLEKQLEVDIQHMRTLYTE